MAQERMRDLLESTLCSKPAEGKERGRGGTNAGFKSESKVGGGGGVGGWWWKTKVGTTLQGG